MMMEYRVSLERWREYQAGFQSARCVSHHTAEGEVGTELAAA